MFGYLGHIKRETGRGDHFEGEMRQLMAEKEEWGAERHRLEEEAAASGADEETLGLLGGEIQALRDALAAFHDAAHPVRRKAPRVSDGDVHVPGLGTPSELVGVNQQLLDDFVAALAGRRRSERELEKHRGRELAAAEASHREHAEELLGALDAKNRTIAFLGGEISRLRAVLSGEEATERGALPELVDDDVPELGDAETVQEGNDKSLEAYREAQRRMNQSVRLRDELIAYLAAEVSLLRGAIAGVFDHSKAVSRTASAPSMDYDVPGLGAPLEIAGVNDGLVAALSDGFQSLKNELALQEQAVVMLQGELAEAQESLSGAHEKLSESAAALQRLAEEASARNAELTAAVDQKNRAADQLQERENELAEAAASADRRAVMIEKLGVLIDELRCGITSVFTEEGFQMQPVSGLDEVEEHVPGFGDLRTIREINLELIGTLHEALREKHGVDDPDGPAREPAEPGSEEPPAED